MVIDNCFLFSAYRASGRVFQLVPRCRETAPVTTTCHFRYGGAPASNSDIARPAKFSCQDVTEEFLHLNAR